MRGVHTVFDAHFIEPYRMFAPIKVDALVKWLASVPFEKWPQQSKLQDGQLRPAMLSGDNFGMRAATRDVVEELMACFPRSRPDNLLMSAVMSGHEIPSHRDEQDIKWLCRAHVPLMTNDKAEFHIGGEVHHMKVGFAYWINTTVLHSVVNKGQTSRVHFMFDVVEKV